MVASIVEFFTDEVLAILRTDLSFFEESVPVAGDIFNIMLAVGVALLLGNLVFQAMKSMATGLGFEGEDPRELFARSMVFGLLLFGSRQICDIGLGLAGRVITLLQIPTAIKIPFATEDMFALMGDGSWLLCIIIGCVLTVQLVKLFLEIAERYVIVAVLTTLSPLAFAMGGSKATMDIFKGWVRMFASMCLMLCLNIVFLKFLISAMRDIPTGKEVFIWLMMVVALAKVARKIDGIVARIGLNPAHTGDPLVRSRLPGMLSMMVFRKVTGSIGGAVTASSGKMGHGGSTASASAASTPSARPSASGPKSKPMAAKPASSGAPSAATPTPATGSGSLSPAATMPSVSPTAAKASASPTIKTSDTTRSSDKHTASIGHGGAGSAGSSPQRPPIGKASKTSLVPSGGTSDTHSTGSTPSGSAATPHMRTSTASPGAMNIKAKTKTPGPQTNASSTSLSTRASVGKTTRAGTATTSGSAMPPAAVNAANSVHTTRSASVPNTQAQQGTVPTRPLADLAHSVHKPAPMPSAPVKNVPSTGAAVKQTVGSNGALHHAAVPSTSSTSSTKPPTLPVSTNTPKSAMKPPLHTTATSYSTKYGAPNTTHAPHNTTSGNKQSTAHKPRTLNRSNNQSKPQRRYNHNRNHTQRRTRP